MPAVLRAMRTARPYMLAALIAFSPIYRSDGAGGGPAPLPPEAARLRQTFEDDARRVVQPIRDRYLSDLQRSLDAATRNGKLEDALAIKAEIEAASIGDLVTIAEFDRKIVGTKWKFNGAIGFTFKGDRTARDGMFWKTVRPYVITYEFKNGYHGTIQFEHDLNMGSIEETSPDGSVHQMTLPRDK